MRSGGKRPLPQNSPQKGEARLGRACWDLARRTDEALGLDPASDIDARLLTDIALGARRVTAEPTLGRLMIQTFTHPRVVEATLKSLGGPL